MSDHMTLVEAYTELRGLLDELDAPKPLDRILERSAHTLRDCARRLTQISERECNGVRDPRTGHMRWNERDQARADSEREAPEGQTEMALAAVLGVAVFERIVIEFQRDPRGAPILVHDKDTHTERGRERLAVFW